MGSPTDQFIPQFRHKLTGEIAWLTNQLIIKPLHKSHFQIGQEKSPQFVETTQSICLGINTRFSNQKSDLSVVEGRKRTNFAYEDAQT